MTTSENEELEEGTPVDGWNLDLENPAVVRFWDSDGWSAPENVNTALLNYLHAIQKDTAHIRNMESHLDVIRFRIGFLALVTLVGIVLSVLFFLSAYSITFPN